MFSDLLDIDALCQEAVMEKGVHLIQFTSEILEVQLNGIYEDIETRVSSSY